MARSGVRAQTPTVIAFVEPNGTSLAAPFLRSLASWGEAWIRVSNVAGSLSYLSMVTQAEGRESRRAHCERRVVLPYPGGAHKVTTRPSDAAQRRSTSLSR